MNEYKYLYGPVPSRRLGLSLGISPIPLKTCNFSCIYCQLGRTNHFINERMNFFDCDDIIKEFVSYNRENIEFDAVTIVGEGEPTLYSGLGDLISRIKELTDKPIAVITNGALMYDERVRDELMLADIVMPSLDSYDSESFHKINRPHRSIDYTKYIEGMISFSKNYKGMLWIEIMLVKGYNDSDIALKQLKYLLDKMRYDKVYINTPIRPPVEKKAEVIVRKTMDKAIEILGGISIENLVSVGFHSEEKDIYTAILNIIRRHPMNQYEIKAFLESRQCDDIDRILERLRVDDRLQWLDYKGYITYRFK